MRLYFKRGISPIVATVLLILVAIATGLVIYAFAAGWVGGRLSEETGPQALLVVEEAYYDDGNDDFIVWVRNDGGTPTDIVRAYIAAPDGSVDSLDLSAAGYTVDPGDVVEVTLDVNATTITVYSGYTYKLTLVGSDGSEVSTTVRA